MNTCTEDIKEHKRGIDALFCARLFFRDIESHLILWRLLYGMGTKGKSPHQLGWVKRFAEVFIHT